MVQVRWYHLILVSQLSSIIVIYESKEEVINLYFTGFVFIDRNSPFIGNKNVDIKSSAHYTFLEQSSSGTVQSETNHNKSL